MKRNIILYLTLLFSVFTAFSISKDSNPKLDKIYELQLGSSEQNIRQITNNATLKKMDESSLINDYYIDEVNRESVRAFYLDRYTTKDGNTIRKIEFYFYKDQLYRIVIRKYNPAIEKWLDKEEASILKIEAPKEEDFLGIPDDDWMYDRTKVIDKKWHTNSESINCKSVLYAKTSDNITSYELVLVNKSIEWKAKFDLTEPERKDREKRYQEETDLDLLERL